MATRKTTIVLPLSRPRNPVLVPGLTRRAGVHGKTRKAARQQARQRTRQCLVDLIAGDMAEFEID